MSDEKILNDVSESEDTGYLESYIRFNDDLEKDYCFQIKVDKRYRDLLGIFNSLPIALRPNVFHHSKPIGFHVSTSPGYLTEDGSLLFSYETGMEKFLKKVSFDDKIAETIWPGQLILPIWEFNSFAFYSFITLLICWLYTDLPDFISPTPGICLTNHMTRGASYLATYFGQHKLAHALIVDIEDPVGIIGQCLFFVFHLIKVLVIFLLFHLGTFNPIRMNRFSGTKVPTDISKEQLIELGWTGSRRATPDEYKEYYRDYKIKEHGGMIQAHQAGVFDTLKNLGIYLGEGEGFNTPMDSKSTMADLCDEENDKFTLSYDYLAQLGAFFASYIEKEGVDLADTIKQFRRFGLLHCTDSVKKAVKQRKIFGDSKINK